MPHDDVRVAVGVFSETVHEDVGPEEEGRGVEVGVEGVVDEEEGMRCGLSERDEVCRLDEG